tara:strand:+ start:304 stop:441 length:138 start_codon:yes stop_codon:yes gene_type:complete
MVDGEQVQTLTEAQEILTQVQVVVEVDVVMEVMELVVLEVLVSLY